MSNDIINIKISNEDIKKAQQYLEAFGSSAETAIVRAINRAVSGVRTDAATNIRKEFNVRAADIRKSFSVIKASACALKRGSGASAKSSGKRFSLMKFNPRPKTATRRNMPKFGVSAVVKKGKRKVYRDAFVGTGQDSGNLLVFRRKDKDRLPVISQTAPSIPQMLSTVNVNDKMQQKLSERFSKNLNREINFILQKNKG
ncbi:MAG: hypothetical protein GY874_17870 [Desulfobacteraceae bacterium]|nr:hypothetical protein [Desulfobacteraceae bacterium]